MDERDIHADIGRYVAKLDVLIRGGAETCERRPENALARLLSAAAFFPLRLHLEILPAPTRAKYARIAGGQSNMRLANSTLLTFFRVSRIFYVILRCGSEREDISVGDDFSKPSLQHAK
ncbi:hypothetical protein [Methylosinus sp. C49]|uniref:hypothetical protein n=1 Tax=Methylosinus sp. C49 TaxID=2699395 RepID=UPI001FCF1297|nr:hypothetical protein [Methylosinus sp. C49]